jgi:hypothetical protein
LPVPVSRPDMRRVSPAVDKVTVLFPKGGR